MNHPSPCCEAWAQDVSLLAAETLEPDEQTAVRQHLAACPACRERLEQLQAICAGLRGASPTGELAGAKLLAAAMVAISEEPRPVVERAAGHHRSRRKMTVAVAAAASVLVAVGAALLYVSTPAERENHSEPLVRSGQTLMSPINNAGEAAAQQPTWIGLQQALIRSEAAFETLLNDSPQRMERDDDAILTPRNGLNLLKES